MERLGPVAAGRFGNRAIGRTLARPRLATGDGSRTASGLLVKPVVGYPA